MPSVWWLLAVAVAGLLGYYAAYRAEAMARSLAAVTIIGLLSCTVPPLAWGHHWVWTVPLLAITSDLIVRSTGISRRAWIGATAGIYLAAFMWFNAWLYRTALHLNRQYPTYVAALDAAIEHMTRSDKLLAVGTHPLLFFVVAAAAIILASRSRAVPEASGVDADGRQQQR
jgi:alpha-1,2-mannosyltransferase